MLQERRAVVKPGAYDVLSAKIIESAGFEAVGVSGYSVSASLLGLLRLRYPGRVRHAVVSGPGCVGPVIG